MDYDLPKLQKWPEILSIPFLKRMRTLNHKYSNIRKGFHEINYAFYNPDHHTAHSLASHLMTRQTQAIEQESVNSFIIFVLNTMGQGWKDEKLSQQLPHKG